mgnify:CR=1 FL=1
MTISPEALRHLMRYDWPGNVRELENTIQRAFALLTSDRIELSDMATLFPRRAQSKPAESAPAANAVPPKPIEGNLMAQQEAETIRLALQEAEGNKREAARILGIGIATLYRKIKKYGLTT